VFVVVLFLGVAAGLLGSRPSKLAAADADQGWLGFFYENRKDQVVVDFVLHGSPADTAGVDSGLVIETVDGKSVPNALGLHTYLNDKKVGQAVEFELYDPATKSKKKVSVTLGKHDSAALLKKSLADGAKAVAATVCPSGEGWARHQGPVDENDTGSALTALACRALAQLPPDIRKPYEPLIGRSLALLLKRMQPQSNWIGDDKATGGQTYETYATAETLLALIAFKGKGDPAVAQLTSGLAARQLGESSPWSAVTFSDLDWQFGGFPFEDRPIIRRIDPRVTVAGTAIALEALHAAGVGPDEAVMQHARGFLTHPRIQNFDDVPDPLLKDLVDGGFPESGIVSKAGPKDVTDGQGNERRVHRSYGSATCDGLAGLIYTGAPEKRVKAAKDWIRNHFEISKQPGFFPVTPGADNPTGKNPFETGIKFYYMQSLARALDACNECPFTTATGSRNWPELILDMLLAAQRRDGGWMNNEPIMNEDNETIAGSFALLALERVTPYIDKK
jgi:hypothetical protein